MSARKRRTPILFTEDIIDKNGNVVDLTAIGGGVTSINGESGAVTLTATDVNADTEGTAQTLVDGLATVATSNSYNDLSNLPVLGTLASQDTVDYSDVTGTPVLGTLASQDSVAYGDVTGTPALGNLATLDTVPTAQIENLAVTNAKLSQELQDQLADFETRIAALEAV